MIRSIKIRDKQIGIAIENIPVTAGSIHSGSDMGRIGQSSDNRFQKMPNMKGSDFQAVVIIAKAINK